MSWDDYDVFCYVIEHGGFSKAARAMDRPKSTVSAAVERLEAALGARLLERTTRHVRPTEAGETLHHGIGPVFAALREAHTDALAQGDTVAGTLRIASSHVFAAHHLGPVAFDLMTRYPKLKVCIEVVNEAINPLDRHFDVAFAILDSALPASSLVVRRMFSFDRGVYASPAFLQRHRDPVKPQDLAALPLVCGTNETEWTFTALDGTTETVPTHAPRLRSGNVDVRTQAAMAGLGVARIASFCCESAVRAGQLTRLLPGHRMEPLRVYALLPSKRLMPAKVRMFLDALGVRASVTA